jgi:lysophospholipase L1-like esterase
VRFLALGDSYTIGEGVLEQERWPNHLARLLRATGIEIDDPHIVARTAWTTDELSDAMDADRPLGPYNLVSLLVGVNDQYRSRPVRSFADGFQVLLRRAITCAGRRPSCVIAISIPDWGATPFAEGRDRALISREVEAYNARGEELASAAAVRWVDITGITRRMQSEPALVATDGLHPSGEMYRLWAELLLPDATAALSRTRSKKSQS